MAVVLAAIPLVLRLVGALVDRAGDFASGASPNPRCPVCNAFGAPLTGMRNWWSCSTCGHKWVRAS